MLLRRYFCGGECPARTKVRQQAEAILYFCSSVETSSRQPLSSEEDETKQAMLAGALQIFSRGRTMPDGPSRTYQLSPMVLCRIPGLSTASAMHRIDGSNRPQRCAHGRALNAAASADCGWMEIPLSKAPPAMSAARRESGDRSSMDASSTGVARGIRLPAHASRDGVWIR